MKSNLGILIKQGLFESLYPKSCLKLSYWAVLCIEECAVIAPRPISFVCILMQKVLSGDCTALVCINTPKDWLHIFKLKKIKCFPSRNFKYLGFGLAVFYFPIPTSHCGSQEYLLIAKYLPGIVPSSVVLTAFQVMSRVFLTWAVTHSVKEVSQATNW